MGILKIIGFTISGLVTIIVIRKTKDEYAFFISLVLCMTLTASAIGALVPVINYLKELSTYVNDSGTFTIMFKASGTAILTTLSSSLCRDSGESALASKVELCGKSIILAMSLPLLKQVFDNALLILG